MTVDRALLAELPMGWVGFLRRIVPLIKVNWSVIGMFVVCLAMILGGTQYFFSWLYVSVQKAKDPDATVRGWSWRWTGSLIAAASLPFFVGMAVIGVVHQAGWMLTSEEPMCTARGNIFMLMSQEDLAFRIAENDLGPNAPFSFDDFRKGVRENSMMKHNDKLQTLVIEDALGHPSGLMVLFRNPELRAKRQFLFSAPDEQRQFLPPDQLPELLKKYEGRLKAL